MAAAAGPAAEATERTRNQNEVAARRNSPLVDDESLRGGGLDL